MNIIEIGYGEALEFGVEQGVYVRKGGANIIAELHEEIASLRQQVKHYEEALAEHQIGGENLIIENAWLNQKLADAKVDAERWKEELGLKNYLVANHWPALSDSFCSAWNAIDAMKESKDADA